MFNGGFSTIQFILSPLFKLVFTDKATYINSSIQANDIAVENILALFAFLVKHLSKASDNKI